MQHRNSLTRCRSPAFRNSSSNNDEDSQQAEIDRERRVDQICAWVQGDVPQRTPLGRKMSDYLPALSEVSQPVKPQLSLCLSRGATLYLNSIPQTAHPHVRDIHDAWAAVTKDAINMEGWEPVDEEPIPYEELDRRWDEDESSIDWWAQTDEEIAIIIRVWRLSGSWLDACSLKIQT